MRDPRKAWGEAESYFSRIIFLISTLFSVTRRQKYTPLSIEWPLKSTW